MNQHYLNLITDFHNFNLIRDAWIVEKHMDINFQHT